MPRYAAQMRLSGFGLSTQQKLRESRVLVIGAGGLGTSILSTLVGAGIGHIGIVDNDQVELGNLHRQFMYTEADIGLAKVTVIAARLRAYNPEVQIQTYADYLDYHNAREIMRGYNVIIDASDNLPTRYCISDTCVLMNKPMIYGALGGMEARLAVLNYQHNASYRCLYPQDRLSQIPSCEEQGVLASTCMLLGALQAQEALKLLGNYAEVLRTMLVIDLGSYSLHHFQLPARSPNLKSQVLAKYMPAIASITGEQLQELLRQPNFFSETRLLIDLRPLHQVHVKPLKQALNLSPQQLLTQAEHKFAHSPLMHAKDLYLICARGIQSRAIIPQLRVYAPQLNYYQVEGGTEALFPS